MGIPFTQWNEWNLWAGPALSPGAGVGSVQEPGRTGRPSGPGPRPGPGCSPHPGRQHRRSCRCTPEDAPDLLARPPAGVEGDFRQTKTCSGLRSASSRLRRSLQDGLLWGQRCRVRLAVGGSLCPLLPVPARRGRCLSPSPGGSGTWQCGRASRTPAHRVVLSALSQL